jgi:hypothetical protein
MIYLGNIDNTVLDVILSIVFITISYIPVSFYYEAINQSGPDFFSFTNFFIIQPLLMIFWCIIGIIPVLISENIILPYYFEITESFFSNGIMDGIIITYVYGVLFGLIVVIEYSIACPKKFR